MIHIYGDFWTFCLPRTRVIDLQISPLHITKPVDLKAPLNSLTPSPISGIQDLAWPSTDDVNMYTLSWSNVMSSTIFLWPRMVYIFFQNKRKRSLYNSNVSLYNVKNNSKTNKIKTCVPSIIYLARPTISQVAITICNWNLFRTDRRMTCEIVILPAVTVGRPSKPKKCKNKKTFVSIIYICTIGLTLRWWPVAIFQDLMEESALPVYKILPRASVDMHVIAPLCPLNIWNSYITRQESSMIHQANPQPARHWRFVLFCLILKIWDRRTYVSTDGHYVWKQWSLSAVCGSP